MCHKRILFFLLICLSAGLVQAAEISKKTAQLVARNFYYERVQQLQSTPYESILPGEVIVYEKDGQSLLYIVNLNNQGYVIVSAEDNVVPVAGYSLEGSYSGENLPVQLVSWMENLGEQIAWHRQHQTQATGRISADWNRLKSQDVTQLQPVTAKGVQPLLISTWDQGGHYNALCPEDPDGPAGRVYAGCVATAMAQVMYYYRYPQQGNGSHGYNSSYGYLSVNFGNTTYNWNGMLNYLSGDNLPVATLLYHCGVAVDMMYSPGGSGAYSDDAAAALRNYFRYNQSLDLKHKDNYSEADWSALLRQNLDAKRPLYYHGFGSGGHAFNVDGYQDLDYFHFNWGWSGSYNGYFYLNNLNPGGQDFTWGQGAIVDIYPVTAYPGYCQSSTTLTALEGTFEDGSGPMNYQPGGDCRWVIDPQSAGGDSVSGIKIRFDRLQTEKNGDYITLYNGTSISDPVLYSFSGDTSSFTLTIPTNKVLVRFTSNAQNESQGFFISYKCLSPEYCAGVATRTDLSGTIEDGSGSKNYANGTICQWLIWPPHAQKITLHFEQFNVAGPGDFVEVYAYDTLTANGSLLGRYFGNTLPPDRISYTGAMYLIFYANSSQTAAGWKASYVTQQVGIEDISPIKGLQLFPIPATEVLNLEFMLTESNPVRIEIVGSTGQQVYTRDLGLCQGTQKHGIDISGLPSGIYSLRILPGGQCLNRKFIVE